MSQHINVNFSVSYSNFVAEVKRAQAERRRPKINISSEDVIGDCERAIEIYKMHYPSLPLQDRCIFYESLKGFNTQILSNGDFSYFRSKHFSKEDNEKISEYAPVLKKIQSEIHEERKILRAKRLLKSHRIKTSAARSFRVSSLTSLAPTESGGDE